MPLSSGARLGPYEIVSSLGRGGMGEVWRARHLKLGREVAIKVLPEALAADRDRLARFEREARLASSLNHPNIITIHDIGEHEGTLFIAMELVEGQTLRAILAEGPLPVARALGYAIQIAEGIARAHAAGILHRDLKPENVMVTADGLVKVLDFGVAKSLGTPDLASMASTAHHSTAAGALVGTPRYMSPEQFSNGRIDQRSDQFSFGILLYEMLAGRPPFDGPSLASIITAISNEPPPPLRTGERDLPADLAKLVGRCLAKKPEERYPSFGEIAEHLRAIEARRIARARLMLDRRAVVGALATLAALAALGAWMWFRGAEARWARNEAPRAIAAHIEAGNFFEAYRLVHRAKKSNTDPELDTLLNRITLPLRVVTDPPGAAVYVKGYETPDAAWDLLGTTPLEARFPYALLRWKIEKEGYEPFEGAPFSAPTFGTLANGIALTPVGSRPPGSVRVYPARLGHVLHRFALDQPLDIRPFWLDRFEVTNRQFKEFVDAGGYRDPALWTDGVPSDAFRDVTGRPGPSTWSVGTWPDGKGDHPVGGVSWYEAAAYCRWAKKALPTIYHWASAIGQDQRSEILRMSNFDREGPAPPGQYQGLGAFGTYDMAGNVREWCANATTEGARYLLGGAWNDPPYYFRHLVAADPDERLPTHGIRCAIGDEPFDPALLTAVDPIDARLPDPVSDEVFAAYAAMYDYDPTELKPEVESVESEQHWTKEVVSFRAAYGEERMGAILFLPRNASPPYQAVVWYPGADASVFPSSETLASPYLFDFIPRSGRALVYPMYDGWYERKSPPAREPNALRDLTIRRAKDVKRTIDYLETRDDIDSERLAFYGFSGGGINGPIVTAIEPRLRASILLAGGIPAQPLRPEIHPAIFAPRAIAPTLMINGVDDFLLPYEGSQKPLFDLLGSPGDRKRHARLVGGHIPANPHDIIREVLDWLDRHLGSTSTSR